MKFISFFLLVLLSASCIKTAEQVNREKRIESMNAQLANSQGLVAEMVGQMKDLQLQIDKLNGRIDEMENRNKSLDPEGLSKMNETVNLVKAQQEAETAQLKLIQNELKEQKAFLEKVMASLSSVSSQNTTKPQKKSAKSNLKSALEMVKTNKYDEARVELESLVDHADLSPGERNKVIHALGKVEFYTKNYEKGLVYFSKIFSKYPKSSLAPSSLLFIGKSLQKMNKKDEAKEAFAKVVEDYPGSSEAKEAKKEI